jgi:hypothetical protein
VQQVKPGGGCSCCIVTITSFSDKVGVAFLFGFENCKRCKRQHSHHHLRDSPAMHAGLFAGCLYALSKLSTLSKSTSALEKGSDNGKRSKSRSTPASADAVP